MGAWGFGRRSGGAAAVVAAAAAILAPGAGGAVDYGPPGGEVPDSEVTRFVIDRDPDGLPYVAGELLVTYRDDASKGRIAAANERVGARTEDRFGPLDARAVAVPEIQALGSRARRESELEAVRRELERDPQVRAAEYNYVDRIDGAGSEDSVDEVFDDPLYGQQWGVRRIRAPQAWDHVIGEDTLIAVLDSGIQNTHPDIGGIQAEGDFVNGITGAATDNNGHGTHVTGIAGANTDNLEGISGTSPLSSFVIGKVCEDTGGGIGGSASCPIGAQVDGLVATADFGGVDVINMSLGGTGCPAIQRQAINYAASKGIVIVAAAGNSASDEPHCPAFYPNVIAVSGTDIGNGDSDFSNFGNWIDIAAPGGENAGVSNGADILSTYPPSTYQFLNGTSMSSPFVAGVASLLADQNLNATQIRKRMEQNATDLPPAGKDVLFGHGLLNAEAAVENRACVRARNAVGTEQQRVALAHQAYAAAGEKAKKAKRKAKRAKRRAKRKGTEKAEKKAKKAKRKKRRAKQAAAARLAELGDAHDRLAFAQAIRDRTC